MEEMRKCEICNNEKDIEEFYTEKEYTHCEECRIFLNKKRKEENKKKNAELMQNMDLLIDNLKNKLNSNEMKTAIKIKIAKLLSKNNL
jgi:hypothetical protein